MSNANSLTGKTLVVAAKLCPLKGLKVMLCSRSIFPNILRNLGLARDGRFEPFFSLAEEWTRYQRVTPSPLSLFCGISLMVKLLPSKQVTGVRFSYPAFI